MSSHAHKIIQQIQQDFKEPIEYVTGEEASVAQSLLLQAGLCE